MKHELSACILIHTIAVPFILVIIIIATCISVVKVFMPSLEQCWSNDCPHVLTSHYQDLIACLIDAIRTAVAYE